MHPFDRASAVRPGSDPEEHAAELDPEWSGIFDPHGGVLAAIVMRAMTARVPDPGLHPQSLTLQYARAPVPGPVRIRARLDRRGRRACQLSARLWQGERECVRALATFTAAFAPDADEWWPPAPAIDAHASVPVTVPAPWWPPFTSHLEYRVALGGAPFSGAAALTGGWVAPREPRPIDAPLLAYLADAWFPSPFVRLRERAAVPTLDLTVHFLRPLREPLAPAPVIARFQTPVAVGGLFVEDGMIWDGEGRPLAVSRQSGLRLAER